MTLDIRFTKYPFIFWTSTKATTSEVDFESKTLQTQNGSYTIKPMNVWLFLALKYLPIFVFMFIFYNKYDISNEVPRLVSYIFAFAYFVPLILFDDVIRRYVLLAMMFVSFVMGFIIGDFNLGAFSIKYFIFLFCIFIFIVDLKFKPFTLFKNGKTYAHFLIEKAIIADSKSNNKGAIDEKR